MERENRLPLTINNGATIYASVAQLEEHWVSTPGVAGSSPVGGTRQEDILLLKYFLHGAQGCGCS